MSQEKVPYIVGTQQASDPAELAWAFPDVQAGQAPLGGRVIVQLRRIKKNAGKIILVEETKENEKWNNMIGRVVAIGPLAYRNRDTMATWPEGSWAQIGDFVRVPRWGGDRWERPVVGEENGDLNPVLFMTINDHEVISKITDDPLSFKVYV